MRWLGIMHACMYGFERNGMERMGKERSPSMKKESLDLKLKARKKNNDRPWDQQHPQRGYQTTLGAERWRCPFCCRHFCTVQYVFCLWAMYVYSLTLLLSFWFDRSMLYCNLRVEIEIEIETEIAGKCEGGTTPSSYIHTNIRTAPEYCIFSPLPPPSPPKSLHAS